MGKREFYWRKNKIGTTQYVNIFIRCVPKVMLRNQKEFPSQQSWKKRKEKN